MLKIPRWVKAGFAIVLVAVVIYLVLPEPVNVEVGSVELRPFFEAVESQGRTRARDPYLITAPIGGRLLRPGIDEGDAVMSGQVLAAIAPAPQDQRVTAYAEASLAAAEARLAVARASLQETRGNLERISRELQRREQLFREGLASAEETELHRQLEAAEEARLDSAQASVQAAEAEVESARAQLLGSDSFEGETSILEIRAPVDGTVYAVMEENERVIQAGTPLMEISNQDQLEVVVDLLTQDAVNVEPGDTVYLSGWGGDQTIYGAVRNIEPEAFTKISALGVEEQRVNVIVELAERPPGLGAEYRVEAAIVTWQGNEVLTIPTSAIFQRSSGWHAFVVEDGVVELRPLAIGGRGRDYTRVQAGVQEGEQVVVYPSDLIDDGTAVRF